MSDKFGYYKEKYCKNNKRTTYEVQYITLLHLYVERGYKTSPYINLLALIQMRSNEANDI